MEALIQTIAPKKLVGLHLSMSLANNRTRELWQKFRPIASTLKHRVSNNFISLQIYDPSYFISISPQTEFVKWATVEVTDFDVPPGVETFELTGGLYAVFLYKGPANDPSIFQYIFGTWLPSSDYHLDNRPHFEVLGDKYSNTDPNSEEEIWIPVRPK